MTLDELLEYIQYQFVEDFTNINQFYKNVNDTFLEAKLTVKYESYNEFCIDILNNAEAFYKAQREFKLYDRIMIDILNSMIVEKMSQDSDYEEKMKNFKVKDKILIK